MDGLQQALVLPLRPLTGLSFLITHHLGMRPPGSIHAGRERGRGVCEVRRSREQRESSQDPWSAVVSGGISRLSRHQRNLRIRRCRQRREGRMPALRLCHHPPNVTPVVSCPRDSCTTRSLFPFPRQEGTRRRCGAIVKRSRRPEEAGKATRRAVLRGPRTSSRAACDAPASRRAALLAGNLARPSYSVRISETGHWGMRVPRCPGNRGGNGLRPCRRCARAWEHPHRPAFEIVKASPKAAADPVWPRFAAHRGRLRSTATVVQGNA